MIRISLDMTYPKFAALPIEQQKKLSVGIGPTGMNMVYYMYQAYPLNSETIGDAGVNQATCMVSFRRPLLFTRESFGIFGNVTVTDFASGRLAALVADYVNRGVLRVTDTDVAVAEVQATATLATTTPIVLTDAPGGQEGAARNADTFTIEVLAAAANPTDTILASFTGTADAILVTITPNDGTNNGAVPVDMTTAELVELINTGAVTGKTVTVTDASSLRALQTASGGDVTPLADGGEGDGVSAAFAGGVTAVSGDLTPAQILKFSP